MSLVKIATEGYRPPEIKKSHAGLLHQNLGVPEGEPISEEKLEAAKHSEDPAVRRRATFALNARKWHHK